MEKLSKKIEQIKELLKALIGMPKIPKPGMPPKPINPPPTQSPVVDPRTPASKKDPGMAGTRTNQVQKPTLKFNKSEQWELEE